MTVFCEIGGKTKKSRIFRFVEFALLEGSLHSLIVVVAPMPVKSTIAHNNGHCFFNVSEKGNASQELILMPLAVFVLKAPLIFTDFSALAIRLPTVVLTSSGFGFSDLC